MEKTILYPDSEENFFLKIRECIASVIRTELQTVNDKDNADEFIDMDQLSDLLKVTKPTIYTHIEAGYYKRIKIGRKVLFSRKEIIEYIYSENNKQK